MRVKYAKARLGFGQIVGLSIFLIITIVSASLFAMMFVEPDDYPEKIMDCQTEEEVKAINGYSQAVRAMKHLITDMEVDEIAAVSYVYDSFYSDTHVFFNILYIDMNNVSHRVYMFVDTYIDRDSYSSDSYKTDVKYISEEAYKMATTRWLEDDTFQSRERIWNDFMIETITEKAMESIRKENYNGIN